MFERQSEGLSPKAYVVGIFRRGARFVSQHGPARAVALSVRHVYDRAFRRMESSLNPPADALFDQTYHVDTSIGQGEWANLASISSSNWMHGTKFQGVREHELKTMLDSIPIRYEDFVFIDLGSGKGRALFVAANYAFRRIVGVEYSRHLHDIAVKNVETYSNPARKCLDIESVCGDAATYDLPKEPCFLFLLNPFDQTVMELVKRNIIASLKQSPRELWILYCHASHADVFLRVGFEEKRRWSLGGFTHVLLAPPR